MPTSGGVLAYGGPIDRQVNLINNTERGLTVPNGLGSSTTLSENVVYTTQKIPVEVRTVTTKTTRTYMQD